MSHEHINYFDEMGKCRGYVSVAYTIHTVMALYDPPSNPSCFKCALTLAYQRHKSLTDLALPLDLVDLANALRHQLGGTHYYTCS